ncbi:39S ribosomal protein L23, mitochondrial isoform X2 [Manis pentadactyla]|uniref:39S ribosomal protein L23, mitochondrial isoform X2 n=1 Tax=Manis pentadactyla TaxID=143292 RepID=UPI00255C5B7C|nr:39S ribosomal protein L23, mitochondrial isoform X2 [Manis pentadactyla]
MCSGPPSPGSSGPLPALPYRRGPIPSQVSLWASPRAAGSRANAPRACPGCPASQALVTASAPTHPKGHRPAHRRLLCTRPAQGRVWLLLRAGQERIRVQAHGQTFTFPDLFPDKKPSPEGGSVDNSLWDLQQRQSQDPRRGGVPDWFGL